jgi:hypothetical protein
MKNPEHVIDGIIPGPDNARNRPTGENESEKNM